MADSAASQDTGFQAPTYSIRLSPDGTLQFDPPQDSPELAIALSLAFPRPKTLDEKMREAQLLFLQTRHQSTVLAVQQRALTPTSTPMPTQPTAHVETPQLKSKQASQETAQPRLFASSTKSATEPKSKKRARGTRAKAASEPETKLSQNQFVWDLHSGKPKQKRTRRTLDIAEAIQVFENRGNVCDYHKAARTKCDRNECSGNKLFQQTMPRLLPLLSETFPGNSSDVHDTETRHLQGYNVTEEHSRPLGIYPPPIGEGRSEIAGVKVSVGLPSTKPIQYDDKPLGQGVLHGPMEWSEDDEMNFQQEIVEFHPGFDSHYMNLLQDPCLPQCEITSLEVSCIGGLFQIRELPPSGGNFEIVAETEKKKDAPKIVETRAEKEDEEDEEHGDSSGGGRGGGGSAGGGRGRGGFGDNNGRRGEDGGGGGNGRATGGPNGSGGNEDSHDPFWGFNGDGDDWYSSMVAVFELAWLAFWFVCLAILVPLSASIKESRETTKPGISNDGGVSNGRCVDDEDDAAAAAARGAGCSGNILATNMDSQLKGLSLKAAESHLFKPTTTPGDPQDNLPVPLRTPEASLLLPYSDRLSITSSTVLSILSRMHSKTRTKTKTKTMMKTKATSTSESTSTLSTLDQQHDLQAFVDSSRSGSLFASSAVRAF